MTDFVTAIGLALVLEGVLYALFPDSMKKMMLHVLAQPLGTLRVGGLVAAVAGVCIVWLIRG
jgi:uncharacterized protein YjeT (DUF2065 family)